MARTMKAPAAEIIVWHLCTSATVLSFHLLSHLDICEKLPRMSRVFTYVPKYLNILHGDRIVSAST